MKAGGRTSACGGEEDLFVPSVLSPRTAYWTQCSSLGLNNEGPGPAFSLTDAAACLEGGEGDDAPQYTGAFCGCAEAASTEELVTCSEVSAEQ